MSPAAAVFIMMNNYFHDVATAMLMACGVTMLVILRRFEGNSRPETVSFVLWMYGQVAKIVAFSVIWIIVSAIPRVLTFRSFEWQHASGKHHEAGLIAKYLLALLILTGGTILWFAAKRKIENIRALHE